MIRDFHPTDLEAVQKLLSGIPEVTQWSSDNFLLASERNFCVRVSEEQGTVCGLVVFRMVRDEAEILNLAVDSRQRRQGIGSRLVEKATEACKAAGVKRIFLEVRESNDSAREFYSRMGFAEDGRRRHYYRQPVEDALVLVRKVEYVWKKS
jgi:ribosomal-protein-alanine N-acetyltransferase